MVLDTSAVICILLREPEADRYIQAIVRDPVRLMSAFSVFEAAVVIEARRGRAGAHELDLLLKEAGVASVPFTAEHFDLARDAYRRFGKGNHPAGLNLGDCASYALSRHSEQPLLFKGQDFEKTDVQRASLDT